MQTVTLSANTSWYLYNFRASTIRRLLADGYRVVCLSPDDGYASKLENELGCEWFPLTIDNKGSSPLKDMGLVVQFWRLYSRLKPVAAFHFTIKNNVYGTWAARVLGVPSINNVSGLGTAFIRSGVVAAIARLLYKTSMPLAYRVFCQNEEDFQLLIEKNLVPASRLVLLPGSGVDVEQFQPDLIEPHGGVFRFLYAGRMLADKGLFELIEAVKAINAASLRCELWLCGFADVENVSAISEAQLQEWGNEPGIKWLGPTDDMVKVYAQVNCVVLPSYREGMPRSLVEAGAMGLPVVATNVPGCQNIIEDGYNGLLCEVKSRESLGAAMQKMLDMPHAERRALGTNGRALVVGKFSESVVIDAAIETMRSIKNGR
ncbi:MAG: glycosyltransferase family 4 protein [Halioglobus sp.]